MPIKSAPRLSSFWQFYAALNLMNTCAPILIVLATVGNTLSLITLQNPTLYHEFRNYPMVLGTTLNAISEYIC